MIKRSLILLLSLCWLVIPTMAQSDDADSAYEEALRRIAEVQRTGATGLNLSIPGLEQVPPEIGNATSLKYIWLQTTPVRTLPPEIGQLSHLEELYLNNNQLEQLPPEIGQLHNLQLMTLNNNQLEQLPPEFGQLQSLRGLDLAQNQITHLPVEMSALIANLNTLYLDDNPLVSPPPAIVDAGLPAIQDYLEHQMLWYTGRIAASVTTLVLMLSITLFYLWRRQRTTRKRKRKPKPPQTL